MVAFENGTNAVGWHLLNSFGQRKKTPLADPEGTPIAWVHEFQQPLITSDWSRETQFPKHGQFLAELGIRSTCALPLARGLRRLGVLEIGNARPHAHSEEDLKFLSLVADQLALAVDAATNLYLSEQAQDRLKLILDLTNQVVSNLDFQQLLRAISASVRQVMHCDAAAIMLPESDGEYLRVHALDFPNSKGFFKEQVTIPIADTMPGQTFRTGRPVVVNRLDPASVPADPRS